MSARADRGQRTEVHAQLAVLGGGPGGYTAAFRAADLGLRTVLIERRPTLGGVCLNVGCIPSKALLHVARVLGDASAAAEFGVRFERPEVDLAALRNWKTGLVERLTRGLDGLAERRQVQLVTGEGRFTSPTELVVEDGERQVAVSFEHCIVATGSSPATLPGLPADERVLDSTSALELNEIPERILVVGGGIVGLELATVYEALGSSVTIVELSDSLIPEADRDLVGVLQRTLERRYERIHLATRVSRVEALPSGLQVELDAPDAPAGESFDRVLVAIGRCPNGHAAQLDLAGVSVDAAGFVAVDAQLRTRVPHIYAVGDVVGGPMLAHKAMHEGKVAAEVIAGQAVAFEPVAIPAVAYTDPELAWAGLTEREAAASGTPYEKASFPWAASGRALTLGRGEGMTKLLLEPETRRILGGGIVGVNAGELVAEIVHAIEMGANELDLALTIHPHPTLSETLGLAAEVAGGTATDIYVPRRASAAAPPRAASSPV